MKRNAGATGKKSTPLAIIAADHGARAPLTFGFLRGSKSNTFPIEKTYSIDTHVESASSPHPPFGFCVHNGAPGHSAFGDYHYAFHSDIFRHLEISAIAGGLLGGREESFHTRSSQSRKSCQPK